MVDMIVFVCAVNTFLRAVLVIFYCFSCSDVDLLRIALLCALRIIIFQRSTVIRRRPG